jgi:phosphoglycolate phosphatase-like HAD superfamily hydrolase
VSNAPRAVAVDLDGALGDTRPQWDAWLADASTVLGIDPTTLPADRGVAAGLLDAAGAGNWRTLLRRFADDRAPAYLRPSAEASAALRRLGSDGTRVGVFTDAPEELAQVAARQLGFERRSECLEAGAGALPRLLEHLGADAPVARTAAQLVALADDPAPRV